MTAYTYFRVTYPVEYVAHVEINRPDRLNSFFEPMWLEIRQVFSDLSLSPEVRAIVFSGAGDRAFTTGLDIKHATSSPILQKPSGKDTSRHAQNIRRHVAEFQEGVGAMEKCEKPVICVMHGYAYGLAIDLSSCADVRICAADTSFAVKEVDIGLAADVGTLSRLPKIVGSYSWVKDVCLSARVFEAQEAEKVGFVSAIYPNKEKAIEAGIQWATLVAGKSPVAVQGTKELLNYSRDHTVQEGLNYTAVWNSAMLQTTDVAEAALATRQQRKPRFEKL